MSAQQTKRVPESNAESSTTDDCATVYSPLAVSVVRSPGARVELPPSSKGHLVTSRSYTTSSLLPVVGATVSPLLVKPCSPPAVAAVVGSEISCGNDSRNGEYVQFLPVDGHPQAQQGVVMNDEDLYCEANCENGHGQNGHLRNVKAVPSDKDSLVQRLKQMTTEKQQLVYKLRDFVETNAQLHSELERTRAALDAVSTKLELSQSTMKHLREENERLDGLLSELKAMPVFENSTDHPVPLIGDTSVHQLTLRGPEVYSGDGKRLKPHTGEVQHRIHDQLQEAMSLAKEQQLELRKLNKVVQQQRDCILGLCKRDAILGLEMRSGLTANTVLPVSRDLPTSSVQRQFYEQQVHAGGGNVVRSPPISNVVSKTSATVTTVAKPTVRTSTITGHQTMYTAPVWTVPKPDTDYGAAAGSNVTDSLPAGFEVLTSACPICQLPIPIDSTKPDAFSRHVDDCISNVASQSPRALRHTGAAKPPSPDASAEYVTLTRSDDTNACERICPICSDQFPEALYTQLDFERHVDDHFVDPVIDDRFVPLQPS